MVASVACSQLLCKTLRFDRRVLVCSRELSFSNVLKNWFGNMHGRFLLHASYFSKLLDILCISKPSFLDISCSRLMSIMLWTLSAAVLFFSFGSYFA